MVAALSLLPSAGARAAAVLQDVEFAALPGNQVRIDLVLSGAVASPRDFATESPARIALDFDGVTSGLAKKTVPISVGPVQSLVAVEGSDRTRVVINLSTSVPYRISTSGNRVIVSINESAAPAPARAAPRPVAARSAAPARASGPGVRDIDFRRGSSGEGRVLITLPSPDTRVAVTEKGKHVVVDIADTPLPQRLLRRLDVVDFATPVVAIESKPKGRDVEVDIETTADYEYLAYQADDLFTLEFRPLTPSEKEQRRKEQVVYSGDRLSLNFQDIEVRAVLQLLADFTGLNVVVSDTVAGNITLRLKNVPWDQALDIILKTKGLSMRQTGNVIMIAPTQEIVNQEKLDLESQQQIEELAPLRSEFIQINYAKAAEIAVILKTEENQLLTDERGNVTVDPRTNTLLVQDTAAKLEDIRRIIAKLDVPVRQVMIESRIVIANNDFARDLGVRFGYTKTNLPNLPDNKRYGEVTGGIEGPLTGDNFWGTTINDQVPLMVNLPAATPSGAINLLIGKIGSYLLQLELSAMQREGRGEIVSSPRVITSDQHPATIKVGQEIPYQESSASGRTTVSFKEAVLKLDVTPHITPDDRISMVLEVKKDNPDFTREVLGVPPVDTRSVKTNVLVDNGETVVLGGVYERTKSFNKEQVPWLGDLPIVGHLFKTTNRQDDNSELLIFVTPKILKEDLAGR
jgi:type IV pilus assembly protein PilQ